MDGIGANKAVAAGLGGAVSVVLVWAVGLTGVVIPAEVSSAFTTIVAALLTYYVPHSFGGQ